MNAVEATAEVFWRAFRALSKKEREAFVEKMFSEKAFLEDLIDLAIIEQRQNESSRSLNAYLADRKKRKI